MPHDSSNGAIRYVQAGNVLATGLGQGEMALLSPAGKDYFGLNMPASAIWGLLEAPRSLDELCTNLCAAFDVEPAECKRDTAELLERLVKNKLVMAIEQ